MQICFFCFFALHTETFPLFFSVVFCFAFCVVWCDCAMTLTASHLHTIFFCFYQCRRETMKHCRAVNRFCRVVNTNIVVDSGGTGMWRGTYKVLLPKVDTPHTHAYKRDKGTKELHLTVIRFWNVKSKRRTNNNNKAQHTTIANSNVDTHYRLQSTQQLHQCQPIRIPRASAIHV